jgi:hypothetical protein
MRTPAANDIANRNNSEMQARVSCKLMRNSDGVEGERGKMIVPHNAHSRPG